MAVLVIYRHLCLQCVLVLPFSPDIDPALLHLSGDLGRHDTPSNTITFSWHLSNGTRDHHQYACFCLRPSMGWMGYRFCKCIVVPACKQVKILTGLGVGLVVDRRCDSCLYLLLPPLCNVISTVDLPFLFPPRKGSNRLSLL